MKQEIQQIKAGIEHYLFLCVVTAIGSISLFATDIYLPALPEMTQAFGVTQAQMQMTFSSFFIGLALCQLIAGVLSDRFGRKRVLVIGISVFSVASCVCALSNDLSQFIGFRLLQAMGGGVGSVVFRTLVVDRFNKVEAAKIFSVIFPIIGLSAAIAPIIGGYLCALWNWRGTFLFMAAFGVGILFLASFFLGNLKEGCTRMAVLKAANQGHKPYIGLIKNVEFMGYALVICTCFCVFRAYTVESPFVFNRQGYVAEEMGFFYIGLSVAYLLGSLFARYISPKTGIQGALSIGIMILVGGALCMIATTFFFSHSPYALIVPMAVIAFGNGLLFPIGSAAALSAVPGELSGTAAGFMGCLQFLLAALCSSYIGSWSQGHAMHLSLFIGIIVLGGLCSTVVLVYKPNRRTILQEWV